MQRAADLALPALGVQLSRGLDALSAGCQHGVQPGTAAVDLLDAFQQGLHDLSRSDGASFEQATSVANRLEADLRC